MTNQDKLIRIVKKYKSPHKNVSTEDFRQFFFMELLRQIHKYDPNRARIESWAHGIYKNARKSCMRKEKRNSFYSYNDELLYNYSIGSPEDIMIDLLDHKYQAEEAAE